jgi:hypothetical protein
LYRPEAELADYGIERSAPQAGGGIHGWTFSARSVGGIFGRRQIHFSSLRLWPDCSGSPCR